MQVSTQGKVYCNIIFVGFKCFVKKKIGGFGYFLELISFGIVLKVKVQVLQQINQFKTTSMLLESQWLAPICQLKMKTMYC